MVASCGSQLVLGTLCVIWGKIERLWSSAEPAHNKKLFRMNAAENTDIFFLFKEVIFFFQGS